MVAALILLFLPLFKIIYDRMRKTKPEAAE